MLETRPYVNEAEDFLASLTAEHYRHGAGLKEKLEIAPIYERHRALFGPEAVAALLADRKGREGRYFAQFAASGLIENQLRRTTEHIATGEAQATVQWDGESVPYRRAGILIADEPDRARRSDLEGRTAAVTAQLNPERQARLARSHDLSAELGFPDYISMCDDLWGLGLRPLADAMQHLLAETRESYQARLHAMLDAADIPRDQATRADLAFLLRAREFDKLFPKESLLPALERTLEGFGIDLRAQPNVTLDLEERPLKSPRAFCAPVRVPRDVRLVTRPRGGHDDYLALFHEAGHTEHFAHTRAEAPFAYRCLGDNSITEAYAFLLGKLITNPDWLRDIMGIEEVGEYLALSRFEDLYYLRRYSAKLAYELELHRAADINSMSARYAQLLGDAMQVRIRPENFLFDVDDFFYSACYLRAWTLEVQLRKKLIAQFGRRWFASRAAGDYLKELWALGQEFTADELTQRLGCAGLEADMLIADLLAPADT